VANGTIPAQSPINDTNAHFQAWGSSMSTGIQNAGFALTADTGQINWGTVTAPGAANTKQGYEIYKFADTLQATAPLFFRIDYGSGAATNNPAYWLTVGTGSDGAGNIANTGGSVYGPNQIKAASSSATQYLGYYSGANAGARGRLCIAMFEGNNATNAANFSMILGIERSKNTAGNDTATGAIIMQMDNAAINIFWHFFRPGAPQPTTEQKVGAIVPFTNTGTMIQGSSVGISTPVTFDPAPQNSGITWLVGCTTDYTVYDTWTFPLYGTTYTWLVLKYPNGSAFTASASTGTALIMHYD
jgi:hypothetical protein